MNSNTFQCPDFQIKPTHHPMPLTSYSGRNDDAVRLGATTKPTMIALGTVWKGDNKSMLNGTVTPRFHFRLPENEKIQKDRKSMLI